MRDSFEFRKRITERLEKIIDDFLDKASGNLHKPQDFVVFNQALEGFIRNHNYINSNPSQSYNVGGRNENRR